MSGTVGKGQVGGLPFRRVVAKSFKVGKGTLYQYIVCVERARLIRSKLTRRC